jgi:formylmethanofuran dehydrogenase subunit B
MSSSLRFVPWFCGLPCAPMTIVPRRGGLAATEGGCPTCREEVSLYRQAEDRPRVVGREVSADRAIDAAASLLKGSRAPFVFGLSRSSSSTAMRAARLASAIGGAIDVEGSEEIQADLTALSTFGLPSATFGEIRDRADLLLLWRCDPRMSHPGLFAAGPRAPRDGVRRIVLLPPTGGPGVTADRILTFDPSSDLGTALMLRELANGRTPGEERPGRVPGDPLREVASWLRRARYSAIIWDAATAASPPGVAVISALTLLARDLNAVARSVARPLGAGGNVAGAVAALAALTGYPRAVGFADGTPRFATAEFDAGRMLAPDGADVLLLVGARSAEAAGKNNDASGGPPPAVRGRRRPGRRGVVIGPRLPRGVDDPDVWIPTATPGLSAGGTAARSDGVTVVLRALLKTRLPTEDEVLDRLLERCAAPTRRPSA